VPKLKDDDTDVNVNLYDAGLWLALTDEAFFHKRKDVAVGTGPLIISNVTVYCVPTPEFKAYKGELPFGLLPSDDREMVHKKLGKPALEIKRRRLDRWTIDGVWTFIQYTADLRAIDNLSLQAPDE
jgi:hypothetical protein